MSDTTLEPPDATLLRIIGGYRATQVVYVAAKLGIPDSLAAGPKDAATLAREVGAHPGHLRRILRGLAALGVVRIDEKERFALTQMGELLRADAAGSMGVAALFAGEESYRAWGQLLHSVRTGETAFDSVYGMGHFEFLERHPEASAIFSRLMAWSIRIEGDPFGGYDFARHKLLVDVGGGKGAMIASVLRANPGLRGILFDQAGAVADAPALLSAAGVADRCEIRVGSAFESVPGGGDVYVMSRVLHDWPDEKALLLLANCRRAMSAGAVLLLVEGVLPSGIPSPSRVWVDLVMMVMTGGRERTEEEWRELLDKSGFSIEGVRATPRTIQDLVEARAV